MIIISFSYFSRGQNLVEDYCYDKIDTVDYSKNEIFNITNEWITKTYHNPKSVVQLNDRESGKIIIKGIIESKNKLRYLNGIYILNYTLSIDIKEGRYRFRLHNLTLDKFTNCQSLSFENYSLIN